MPQKLKVLVTGSPVEAVRLALSAVQQYAERLKLRQKPLESKIAAVGSDRGRVETEW